jgi:Nitrate reductase delta subunit
VNPGRCELLRALGAVADSPADARVAGRALGLPDLDGHQHTDAFIMNCPPYASVSLGPDGALGGEGADRVAGFWRAIGVAPPAEPDHLAALLSLYASLGEAADQSRRAATATVLARSRAEAGVGYRIGERRFALRAMLEQDPAAMLTWLSRECGRWARRHARGASSDAVSRWWAGRAAHTGRLLRHLADAPGSGQHR